MRSKEVVRFEVIISTRYPLEIPTGPSNGPKFCWRRRIMSYEFK